MKLVDLKKQILDKELEQSLFVFQYSDSTILCNQYIDAIASLKQLNKVYIQDLTDHPAFNPSMFEVEDNNLYIYITDELTKQISSNLKNTIIVCNSIVNAIAENVEPFLVVFPKIENWHLIGYIKASCPGLDDMDADQLMAVCGKDPYRVINEVDKIKLFDKMLQKDQLRLLIKENNFVDATNINLYQLSNLITRKDMDGIRQLLVEKSEFEPMEVVGILKRSFLNIIKIQMDPKATADSLKMNYKQFAAIKYNCNKYTNGELIEIYKFLTEFDYRLKSGQLDLKNKDLVDYILCSVLTRGDKIWIKEIEHIISN